ncbi:MAG: hypothetical protein NTX25_11575, partial [Proteobacteria bacterium]|nr:hypothetical protein [Pseudomonadota bacterium]
MFKFHICLRLLGLSLTLLSAKLFANDIFEYQGGFNRAFGGAGTIMSRGGESVLQNPANLWVNTKSDMYADIGFFHLGYSVTTPESNVKPGSIAVPAIPLPSIGATYKLGQWSLGGLFFPTGIGSKNKVSDFPVQLNGQYQSVDIDAAQKGFKIGLGLAYRISSNFSLGLSIIYDKFDTESNIKLTDSDSIHTRSSSKFIRPIIGLRYRWAALGSFAFSYQFKKAAPYSLEVQAFSEETQFFTRSTYRPTVYTLGALTRRIGSFRFFGQYSYEVWVPATFIAQA